MYFEHHNNITDYRAVQIHYAFETHNDHQLRTISIIIDCGTLHCFFFNIKDRRKIFGHSKFPLKTQRPAVWEFYPRSCLNTA